MNDTETDQNIVKPPKRPYRRITKDVITRHNAEAALVGNGTRAVESLTPEYRAPHRRAYQIVKKGLQVSNSEYVDTVLEQVAVKAADRLEELVDSTDEAVATRNVHFALEQKRGKAVQKTQSENVNINIETVLG